MTESSPFSADHYIYTGRQHRGNKLYEYGKCRCGAVLQGRDEIDAHREEYSVQVPGPS